MRPDISKHRLADDTIHKLKSGIRVRVYNKFINIGYYLVIQVKDGKQFLAKKEDFMYPNRLLF